MKVTLDSNVWRKVASPERFPNDTDIQIYEALHQACAKGTLVCFISENTFTLEQISRQERVTWLTAPKKITKKTNKDIINISISRNNTIEPNTIQMVKRHLEDAFELGMRVLPCGRIMGPRSALLEQKYFLTFSEADFHRVNDRNGEISRTLETLGFGISLLKDMGKKHVGPGEHWTNGLANLSEEDSAKIPDLVAEWADVDAVTISIANGISYFCSNDLAKGARGQGINSILLQENSSQICNTYGIKFVSPQQLAMLLPNREDLDE